MVNIMQTVALLVNVYIAFTEKQKRIYLAILLSNISLLLTYYFNGDTTTTLIYCVISIRSLCYLNREKFKTNILPYVVIAIQLLIGIFTMEDKMQIISTLIPCYTCWYLWFYKDTQKLRIGNIISQIAWAIYNVLGGLYIILIMRAIIITSNVVAYSKRKKELNKGIKEEQMSVEKDALRKEYISIRKSIENKVEKSRTITDKVIETDEYKEAKVIALYKSMASEVSTEQLIEKALKDGKIVALPRVINNEMRFYKISIGEKLEKSKFGVLEPAENEEDFIDKSRIDLVIVPGVCFDKNNNRMGFGKGNYDKYLAGTNLKTIGICFKEQIVDELPTEKTDIRMSKIITE